MALSRCLSRGSQVDAPEQLEVCRRDLSPGEISHDPAKLMGELRPRVERRFLHAVGEGEGEGDGEGPENPLASR